MSIYRLTGTAEAVRERNGVSNKGTAEERAWTMREQPIRVNDFVVTDVTVGDDDDPFRLGENVDLIVDVTARGGYLSTRVRGAWPKDETATGTAGGGKPPLHSTG